jgi:hypothetical protein
MGIDLKYVYNSNTKYIRFGKLLARYADETFDEWKNMEALQRNIRIGDE